MAPSDANVGAAGGRRYPVDVYDEIAYCYDGTLEGLLSAIFASYANHEDPSDVLREEVAQPRLSQRMAFIDTDLSHAMRVRQGLVACCGFPAYNTVRKASVSSDAAAGTAAYRFVRYAMDEQSRRDCTHCRKRTSCEGARDRRKGCPRRKGRALSDITHPAVEPVFRIARAVDDECEKMRQFIRFRHLHDDGIDVWFAQCNPRDAVVALVMDHFAERFNDQPFVIYDENHHVAGIYEGSDWYLVRTDGSLLPASLLPPDAAEEASMQKAWQLFYRTVAVNARYNPELRRHFMPMRLWKNLTEMQAFE